jgi:uncharacterized membrane protein
LKSLNKYLWLSSIIVIVSIVYYLVKTADVILDGSFHQKNILFQLKLLAGLAVEYLHHLVSLVWLWFAAREEALSKSSWAVFGLAFGMLGVAVFYTANIYYRERSIGNENS